MITAENPAVKVGLLGAKAWSDAVTLIRDDVPRDDEMRLLEWQAAGLVDDEGHLDGDWATALKVTQDALKGAEVVSVYDGVVFSATLFVDGSQGTVVCVTARGAYAGEGATQVIDAVHPMLEISSAPASEAWLLVRRVLPPLDQLRAHPREARPEEVTPVSLAGVELPDSMKASPEAFANHLLNLPTLPSAVVDALDPTASVFLFSLDGSGGSVSTSSQAWALGNRGLYRVDSRHATVAEVPVGDLGHQIVAVLA